MAITANLSEKYQSDLNTGTAPFLSPEVAVQNQAKMSQGRLHYPAVGAQHLGKNCTSCVISSTIWLPMCPIYPLLDSESSQHSVALNRGHHVVISPGSVGSCWHASPTAAVSRVQGWNLLEATTHTANS